MIKSQLQDLQEKSLPGDDYHEEIQIKQLTTVMNDNGNIKIPATCTYYKYY